MDAIKLLVADDHTILRQGLVAILEQYSDICVIAEADNGESLVDKYATFKPDVVLTDIEMPGLMNGLEAAQKIIEKYPDAKILFLSMHNNDEIVYQILKINAHGLLPKEVIKNELIHALRTIAKGGIYFHGRDKNEINKIKAKYSSDTIENGNDIFAELTSIEKQILLLVAEGKTSQEIADIIHKSKRTVDSIRASLMTKVGVDSLPKLIKRAIEYSIFLKKKKKKN